MPCIYVFRKRESVCVMYTQGTKTPEDNAVEIQTHPIKRTLLMSSTEFTVQLLQLRVTVARRIPCVREV